MKKTMGMFLALILALGMSGLAYANWMETLIIDGTVNTGSVDVEWSEVGSWDTDDFPYAPDGKDVSWIDCWIDADGVLHVEVYNAYPSIDYYNVVDIHSVGSIPVHLYGVVVSNPNPEVEVDITYWYDEFATQPVIDLPVQLHQSERIYALIHVHITQQAIQNYTYYFDAQIDAIQWNEPDN